MKVGTLGERSASAPLGFPPFTGNRWYYRIPHPRRVRNPVKRDVHMAVATSSGQTSFVFLFSEVNLKDMNRTRRVRVTAG